VVGYRSRPYTTVNQQYGPKAGGSKKSTWLADKVLTIIK